MNEQNDLEKFYKIPKYHENYGINKLGQVRGLRGILKPLLNKNTGYCVVRIKTEQGELKTVHIHKLMAYTFLAEDLFNNKINAKERIVVDHLNHDKTDNRLSNLRVISHRHNLIYSSIYKNKDKGEHSPGVMKMVSGNYSVIMSYNKNVIRFGTYKTFELAKKVYKLGVKNVDMFENVKQYKRYINSLAKKEFNNLSSSDINKNK
jgi:hypothetical protein